MNLEDQLKNYKALCLQIEQLEEMKKSLSAAILKQMQSKKIQFNELIACKYERLNIKLTVEQARSYQATTMQEIIDRKKIKALFEEGKIVEGVAKNAYLIVKTNLSTSRS